MKRDYDDEEYTQFRLAVLKRDKNICQMPNCGNKYGLNVHHIKRWADAPWLRYEVSNGITLCRRCHKTIKGAENIYAKLFTEIVNDNT